MKLRLFLVLMIVIIVFGTSVIFVRIFFRSTAPRPALNAPIVAASPETASGVNPQKIWKNSSGDVILKENPDAPVKVDVFVRDAKGKENFFMNLSAVYRDHYHFAEYHHGSLYIIRRVFNQSKSPNNWTDQLWRYDSEGKETLLYTMKGLDFRVSEDEEFIAITGAEAMNKDSEMISFLRKDGSILKALKAGDLYRAIPNDTIIPILWSDGKFWIQVGTAEIKGIARIDPITLGILTYDLSSLPINMEEFALNASQQKIVFSDFPKFFDAEGFQKFKSKDEPVHLFIYDLQSRKKEIIATSKGKNFQAKWLDAHMLQYKNPSGQGEVIQDFP